MKSLVLLWLGVGLLFICGECMAGIKSFNTDALNRFKQRIKYEQLASSIQDSEKAYLDWVETLNNVTLPDGSTWDDDGHSTSVEGKGVGSVSGHLIHKSDNVIFEIYVFTEDANRSVADQAINLASYTSMGDLNFVYLQHPKADFFIYGPHWEESSGYNAVICSFRNVILKLSASSEKVDVKPFAEYFLNKMAASVVPKAKLPKISATASVPSNGVKVGDSVWLEINVSNKDPAIEYNEELDIQAIPEGLEYMRSDGSKYLFDAEKAGDYAVDFTVLDTQYLITSSGQYLIHVAQ